MPTIHREAGFSIRIYLRDHHPPHVHVWKGRDSVKVAIGDEETSASVLAVKGMRDRDIVRAVSIVEANWRSFLQKWEQING